MAAPTIIFFDSYNDANGNEFILAFLSDGSITQIALPGETTFQVAPPGTLQTGGGLALPQMVSVGLNGHVVVAIIGRGEGGDNGYFIWDGVNNAFFKPGTASPVTTILDGGNNYTSPPMVAAFTGGAGTGVGLQASISLGAVDQVTVTAPGTGFTLFDQAILVFAGGGQGETAYGLGNLQSGVVTSITVVNGGYGYIQVPTITITPVGGGSGATAIVTGVTGGVIQTVQVLTGGSGYNLGATVTDNGQNNGQPLPTPPAGGQNPQFQQAVYQAVVENGVVVGVTMVNQGTLYNSPPTPNYLSSSGSGAGGVVDLVGGSITGVTFNYPSQGGSGYTAPVIVQFVGGGGPASGTLELMPFGIIGNAIETYQSRVWIANGNRIMFSAPESIVDFGGGGGEFQSVDGSLRYLYERLVSSNGFLYVIGDSAVYYISGVNTGPISSTNQTLVTTFSYLNVDPQIGSPWPQSVKVMGRRVMLANSSGGIYAITGGAVEKVSDPVDNLFYTQQFTSGIGVYPRGEFLPSAAVVTLFSKPCYALLLPIINPLTGGTEVQILLWDGQPGQEVPRGRWFTATQSIPNLAFINGLESNSTLTAYGTDGNSIYSLFTTASNAIEKIVQSRLWFDPTIVMQKKSWGIYALFECYGDTTLNFTTDTEGGSFTVDQGTFTGTGSEVLPVTTWARSSAPSPAGITIGFTMTSSSPDFALIDICLLPQDYSLKT